MLKNVEIAATAIKSYLTAIEEHLKGNLHI